MKVEIKAVYLQLVSNKVNYECGDRNTALSLMIAIYAKLFVMQT
jgi:hypothetical protein